MGRGISLALLGLLAVLTASGRASPARPLGGCSSSDTIVTIADFSFTPSSVTINAGDTVCWTNAGTFDHTATSNDATTFDSGQLANGATYRHTFTTGGDYPYKCTYHPLQMTGTIHVNGGPPPPPPPPPPAPPPPPPPPVKCHVPNMVGRKLAGAKARIRRRHCRVGKITRVHSSLAKKGRVVSQRPKAGKTLKKGARVNLRIGK